ncbi:DUF4132 domain-containing protein [Spirillospora sp. NPDC048911]|uniref:DUF4132 domain-containing protein n=1 Tax=Spirillospora sp. NPDC048911 TaxID=3364527 RepID=UPI00371A2FA5
MTKPPAAPVEDAPADVLPRLLLAPPWTVNESAEPVVLKGLKRPKQPTILTWQPGEREEWLEFPYNEEKRGRWVPQLTRQPDDTDWEALAESFLSGRALSEYDDKAQQLKVIELLMQGPEEYGRELLDDERYSAHFERLWVAKGLAARYEMAALPMLKRLAKRKLGDIAQLLPFRDAEIAQLVLKEWDNHYRGDDARAWFDRHGPDGVALIIPDVVRRPGPKREVAEQALRMVAQKHGHDAVVAAVRVYGDEAADAIAKMRVEPLDLYPDPLPELAEDHDPARLPRILLRGRKQALPADATRHFLTMLSISEPGAPYAGVDTVVDLCDPESLAEFAWAVYKADQSYPRWASPWVEFTLVRLADDETVRRLAPVVMRWSRQRVWDGRGVTALDVFSAVGTDEALRLLHQLAQKAQDKERIRPWAEGRLKRAAEERGLTAEQLADRLVPGLGLDSGGGMTLDYGPRRFTVGFDEQLKPYVADEDGKRRKSLPKPGAKDDDVLAPAAYQRFGELKKEARTVAGDQIKRLEKAMVTARRWTPEEFRGIFLDHPLLWHIARRLVWTAEEEDGKTTTFRVAEDRTLADADDDVFTVSATARIGLPHPLLLGDELAAWSELFADYEILQPFPQLGRVTHGLAEGEGDDGRLRRFEGRDVHFGTVLGLTRRGWTLGEKETGGYQRFVSLKLSEERSVVVDLDPGIRVLTPDEHPVQRIEQVGLFAARYSRAAHPFGGLDPVTLSETLADLATLTEITEPR